MMFLPIVERELRLRARDKNTWRVRGIAAGVAFLIGVPLLFFSGPGSPFGMSGQEFFYGLTALTFLFCAFEGARQTSDCISGERREGTLGLLFLTDLKGYDIILGKLAVNSIHSFFGLLAVFPILSLGMLAGGITAGEFWRVTLALCMTLSLSLATGLVVSVHSTEERKTILGTILLLAALSGGLPVLDSLLGFNAPKKAFFSLGSPVFACAMATEAAYSSAPSKFWLSETVLGSLTLLFLIFSGRALRVVIPDASSPVGIWKLLGAKSGRANKRLLDAQPVAWLVGRNRLLARCIAGLVVLRGLTFAFEIRRVLSLPATGAGTFVTQTSFVSLVLGLVAWILLAYAVCEFFSENKKNGFLDLLLCSPLSDKEIIRGHRSGMTASLRWILILLVVNGALAYVPFWIQRSSGGSWFIAQSVSHALDVLSTITGFFAIIYVGAWFALTSRKATHGVAKTVLFALILPIIGSNLLFPLLGIVAGGGLFQFALFGPHGLLVLTHLFLIKWAQRNFTLRFREMAVRQITGEPKRRISMKPAVSEYFGLLSDPK